MEKISFIDTLLEVFLAYWHYVVIAVMLPYLYPIIPLSIKFIKRRREIKKRHDFYRQPIITEEQKYLGITIPNSDVEVYKERIEKLILTLNESTETVLVGAVEAILIAELNADSIFINDAGELVIDKITAKKFSKYIYKNPMEFLKYIKSIETKLNINKNKIPLDEALFMMRNAKKFGLKIDEGSKDTPTSILFKVKSSIHLSGYKDIVVRVVDEENEFERKNSKPIITLMNTFDFGEEKVEPINTTKAQPIIDASIVSSKILEDGFIELTLANGNIVVKTDRIIRSVETQEDRDKEAAAKNKTQNQVANIAQQVSLGVDKLSSAKGLNNTEETELSRYTRRFGELDDYEKAHATQMRFKDRSFKRYAEEITEIETFKEENLSSKTLFDNDNLFISFLVELFKLENRTVEGKQYIFTGQIILPNKTIPYISLDIHYLLNVMYMSIKRDSREDFFQFVYPHKKINLKQAELVLENINKKYNILKKQNDEYLKSVVFTHGEQTIKTSAIYFDTEVIKSLLDNKIDSKIFAEYNSTQKIFGPKAQGVISDITYNFENFYRVPSDEKN